MILTIVFSLSLFPQQEIKQQTYKHVLALRHISALQVTGSLTSRVSLQGGELTSKTSLKQAGSLPAFKHGPFILDAWYVLLRESQLWTLTESGDHFIYRDRCGWFENGHELVPCTGEIYVDGLNVQRIVQRLETKKWGTVTLDMKYGWIDLSQRRLVPVECELKWKHGSTITNWIDYDEFYGNEPVVKEIDAPYEMR